MAEPNIEFTQKDYNMAYAIKLLMYYGLSVSDAISIVRGYEENGDKHDTSAPELFKYYKYNLTLEDNVKGATPVCPAIASTEKITPSEFRKIEVEEQ